MVQPSKSWRTGGLNEGWEPDEIPVHTVEHSWPSYDDTELDNDLGVFTAEQTVLQVLRRWAGQAGLLGYKPDEFLDRTEPSQGQTVRLLNSALREDGSLVRLAPLGEASHYELPANHRYDRDQVVILMTAPHDGGTPSQPGGEHNPQ